MLVALVLTVCAVTDPKACHVEEYTFQASGDLTHCMFEAPPFIAEWAATHPDLKVAKWKCAWPGSANDTI